MPPMPSSHEGHLPDLEDATVIDNGFQMPPLPYSYRIGEIYSIRFKMVYLDHLAHITSNRARWQSRN